MSLYLLFLTPRKNPKINPTGISHKLKILPITPPITVKIIIKITILILSDLNPRSVSLSKKLLGI